MTSTLIENPQSQRNQTQFPVAMKWQYDDRGKDLNDKFKTGEKVLIVWFISDREGICIYQKDTGNEIGVHRDWSNVNTENWAPFVGKIELSFP